MKGVEHMDEEKDYMLSTYDNPFNPFEDFETWWKQDLALGHDCCGTLAREANISSIYSDKRNDEETVRAIKEIVKREPAIYRIVYPEDFLVSV